MPETLSAQLTRVQTAIAAIENGGQSYSIAGRAYTRGNLKDLYDREERLLKLIDREGATGTAGRSVAEF